MAADLNKLSRVFERLVRESRLPRPGAPATAVIERDAATQTLLASTRQKVELARLRRELAELERLENVSDLPRLLMFKNGQKIERWFWERRWLIAVAATVVPFVFPAATSNALAFLGGTLAKIIGGFVLQTENAIQNAQVELAAKNGKIQASVLYLERLKEEHD